MVLLIDIGNSNISFGIYNGKEITQTFRLITKDEKSADEYAMVIKGIVSKKPLRDAIISSVVPEITVKIKYMLQKYFAIDPLILGPGLKTGLKLRADEPKSVGADLIADTVAGLSICEECLIVDLGTATKFLYGESNTLAGVVIAPGVEISTKAMIGNTALLPNIDLIGPKKVLNNSTIPCMQSGVIYGFASMVDGMIYHIRQELKKPDLKVIATGGLSSVILPYCKTPIQTEKNLLLLGLIEIYKKNRKY